VPSASASAPPSAVPSVVPSAAPSVVASASASTGDDPDDALTGGQALAQARAALNGGNAKRAATLAQKAVKKGAGGSAYYVLGAAYQAMGATGAAKSAYGNCAKSGAPEASECADLVANM